MDTLNERYCTRMPITLASLAGAFLRVGGRLCTFTPAIEQAQAVREALARHRCGEVRTFECIRRPLHVVRPNEGDGAQRRRKRPHRMNDAPAEAVDSHTAAGSTPFAVPATECAGHSGYLTFATFLGPEK